MRRPIAFLLLALAIAPSSLSSAAGPSAISGNTRIDTFDDSKKLLLNQVYTDHRRTLYCDSSFDENKNVKHDRGYVPAKPKDRRAYRLEWEHVVPAEAFGKSFKEWRDGDPKCMCKGKPFKGRNCAQKASKEFRLMEADMYNLYPETGEINGLRSNYSYSMLLGVVDYEFGTCKTRISTKERKIEPRPEVRGDIARTYFYMEAAYPGHGIISDKNKKLFEAWDKQDPVDQWECERAQRIEKIQGNSQVFVKDACMDKGWW